MLNKGKAAETKVLILWLTVHKLMVCMYVERGREREMVKSMG